MHSEDGSERGRGSDSIDSIVLDEPAPAGPSDEPLPSGSARSSTEGIFVDLPPLQESALLSRLVDDSDAGGMASPAEGEEGPLPADGRAWSDEVGGAEETGGPPTAEVAPAVGGEALVDVLHPGEEEEGPAPSVPLQLEAAAYQPTEGEAGGDEVEREPLRPEQPQEVEEVDEGVEMELDEPPPPVQSMEEEEEEEEENDEKKEDEKEEEAPALLLTQQLPPEQPQEMAQPQPREEAGVQQQEKKEGEEEEEDSMQQEEERSPVEMQPAQAEGKEEEEEEEEEGDEDEDDKKEEEEPENDDDGGVEGGEEDNGGDDDEEDDEDDDEDEEVRGREEEEEEEESELGGASADTPMLPAETVSIGSVLASVWRGLKRPLPSAEPGQQAAGGGQPWLPQQPSDDDDDGDDSDVVWVDVDDGDEEEAAEGKRGKPRAEKRTRQLIEATRKCKQETDGKKKYVARGRAHGSRGGGGSNKAARKGGSAGPAEKRPCRALPLRSCTRPELILRRATLAEVPSRSHLLADPMSIPTIATMIARLPSNRVWQVEKSACQLRPDSLRHQLETYKTKGSYSCMTHDTVRNVRFETSLKWATKNCNRKRWLEVGTGADAVLTLMLLKSSGKTQVMGVEVNEDAVQRARLVLKTAGLSERVILVNGLSTDSSTIETVNEFGPFDAILHELIGLFAGCEGAAYLLQRLKVDYHLSGSVLQVPCAAATFFAPALILPDDFNAQHFDVYVVNNYFSLVKRLGITAAQEVTGGRGEEWLKSGVLEFLDFMADQRLDLPQSRSTSFISPDADAYVNALVCWIWVETSRDGAAPRSNQTAYPYGASPDDAPPRSEGSVAFSSRNDDTTACASNWRNMIIPFKQTHRIPRGAALRVDTCANLKTATPSYHFVCSCNNTTLCERHIFNMVPTYIQFRHLVAMSQASAAAAVAAAKKR